MSSSGGVALLLSLKLVANLYTRVGSGLGFPVEVLR